MNLTVKEKKAKPTIADVARLSGVVRGTASKALDTSGRYGLSDEVRRRVIAAAEQLGYKPRNSFEANACVVCLVYFRSALPASDYHEQLVSSIASTLASRDCQLIHIPMAGDLKTTRHLLHDRRIRGCIVIDPIDGQMQEAFQDITHRTVLVNAPTDSKYSQVHCDYLAGAQTLAQHLVDLGHRKISLCKGGPKTLKTVYREQGFENQLQLSRLEGQIIASPAEFMQLSASRRGTAVIADTLKTAIELLHHCRNSGIRVPQDLSIATFDDGYPAEMLNPPLTAMRSPADLLGKEAAVLLVDQIHGEQAYLRRKLLLPETLIVRQSTAAPKQK